MSVPSRYQLTQWLQRYLALIALALATACCGKQTVDTPKSSATEPPAAPAGVGLYKLPHVTILAVTDWQTTIKPCGCTVDLQKGGVERIAKYVKDLRAQDDSVVVVHAGSLFAEADSQSSAGREAQLQLKRQTFTSALRELGVAAAALSSHDLDAGGAALAAAWAQAPWPVLAAGWDGGVRSTRPRTVVKTASGIAVGLTAIDPKAGADDAARQVVVQAEVAALRKDGAQVVVVLSNLGLRGSRKLARAVQGIDALVVGALDERTEPALDLEVEGQTILIHATRHGAWFSAATLVPAAAGGPWQDATAWLPGAAAELQARKDALVKHIDAAKARGLVATQKAMPMYQQLFADMDKRIAAAKAAASQPLPKGPLCAYRSVGLDWSAPVDDALAALVAKYDAEVGKLNEAAFAQPLPLKDGMAQYVGQAACLSCHTQVQEFAKKDLHGHAWQTLVDAGKTKDLDCVPCHVTGWQQPGGSAFANLDTFQNVQCEACHGPGSLHIAAPAKGANSKLLAVGAAQCLTCHAPEHAPRFAFDEYKKRILQPGHGLPLAGSAPP